MNFTYKLLSNPKNRNYLFDLVFQKARAGLRVEASRGYLGVLWWIIEPLMYMSVFYVVFAHIFKRGDENFILFLLTGLIVWKWFLSTINTGAASLMANVGLMNQVYLPKIVFPLTAVAIATFKFLIIASLFFIFVQFTPIKPSLNWLLLPLIVITQLYFNISIACFFSAIMPFIPDLRVILDNLLMMLLFASGIFFDLATFPDRIQKYLMFNPVALLIHMYRELLLKGISPNGYQFLYIILLSSLLLSVAIVILNRFDREYPKIIH